MGVIAVLIVIGGFAYIVPVVPTTVNEPYETVETYEEQEPYETIETYQEEEPYETTETYEELEPYNITETYEEQEPYIVEVPYTVEVDVTKTQTVCDLNTTLDAPTSKLEDFSLATDVSCNIYWNCTEEVNLFSIMTEEAWEAFYHKLVIRLGLPAVHALISGYTVSPETVESILSVLPDLVNTLSDENYHKMDSNGDKTSKHLNAGSHKIFIFKADGSGSLNAYITYDYETTETETQYRTETEYRAVNKTRTVTKYETVEKTRTVTKYRTVAKIRTVTKYETVEKTRTVTKYRDVIKRITLFEYLTG